MQFVCQCTSSSCGLRFPADSELACPRCKSACSYSNAENEDGDLKPDTPVRSLDLHILVDNVRSVFNVGSIFRSAEGAGASHIYLGGISPTPEHPRLAKTALGAQQSVPWTHDLNALQRARELRRDMPLWSLERSEHSKSIFDLRHSEIPSRLCLVVGHEVVGVDQEIRCVSDRMLHIPMCGAKISLNVATAFGIACYRLLHQT